MYTPCDGGPYNYYLSLEQIKCGTCLIETRNPGCSDRKCRRRVCKEDESCCEESWSATCVDLARELCNCESGEGLIINEDEPCGDDINGGCFSNPPAYGSIDFGQTILGEYGAVFDSDTDTYQQDTDWYLFHAKEPGTCVRATLESNDTSSLVLFEGSTFDSDGCKDNLVNLASGDSSGNSAAYCFEEAGKYGVFVAPTFQNNSPCEGDPHTYILTLEHLGKCGTCLVESKTPGCTNRECERLVCEHDDSCCSSAWDSTCIEKAKLWCECAGGKVPNILKEDELCGEDINGGCFNTPPAYGRIELNQTVIGEFGAVRDGPKGIFQIDTDWYLFQTYYQNTCVQATLTSRKSGDVIFFEGSTYDAKNCLDDLLNVASGDSSGKPAVYCFEQAGEYGVFVAPTYEDKSPCKGEPNTYVLSLSGLECGTCFIEHDSPGCSDTKCQHQVCNYDKSCCKDAWDAMCVEKAKLWCDCSKEDKPESSKSKSNTNSDKNNSKSKSKSTESSSADSGNGKGSRSSSESSSESGKGNNGGSSNSQEEKGIRSSRDSSSGKGSQW